MIRGFVLTAAFAIALCGCAEAEIEEAEEAADINIQTLVSLPEPVEPIPIPVDFPAQTQDQLLEAISQSAKTQKVLRSKQNNGEVVLEQDPISREEAIYQWEQARFVLSFLSESTVPTYALFHRIDDDGRLEAWLISPDGGVLKGVSEEVYDGLGQMAEGLGVKRMAISRSRTERGVPLSTEEEIRAAEELDRSPEKIAERGLTLERYANVLLPGSIRDALGTREGRLIVIPARDTGVAPYAALPLANGFAVENWSFVLLPDFATFAEEEDPIFDFESLDIGNAVIVGDPDLTDDPQYNWAELPGAREEAKLVANTLQVPEERVMIGQDATRSRLVDQIHSDDNLGLVYIASHAISHPRFPLTRGYVAMSGGHYFAGHIRQENFPGWKRRRPLVVLSACQTALGRFLDGGGFGIARTWTTAGAGQVVGSLWNVSDKATKVLMTNFTRYLKEGHAPEFAMQKAQKDTLNYRNARGKYPYINNPKMWASFTVFGYPSISTKEALPPIS